MQDTRSILEVNQKGPLSGAACYSQSDRLDCLNPVYLISAEADRLSWKRAEETWEAEWPHLRILRPLPGRLSFKSLNRVLCVSDSMPLLARWCVLFCLMGWLTYIPPLFPHTCGTISNKSCHNTCSLRVSPHSSTHPLQLRYIADSHLSLSRR